MTTTVRYLHHPTSQPCRAVHQFMLEVGIPFEEEYVDLLAGANEEPAFKHRYNPTGQVPILVDGDFTIWESAAIASYLNERFSAPAHWFGESPRNRALVQQFLHWHSTTLRRGAGAFFYTHFAECIWGKQDYSREIEKGYCVLEESMGYLEQWLSQSPYLCGDTISYADLQCFHEFVSHEAGQIISPETWMRFSAVRRWFERLAERPHAKTVSQVIQQAAGMRLAGTPIPMQRRTSLAKGTEVVGAGNIGIPYPAVDAAVRS